MSGAASVNPDVTTTMVRRKLTPTGALVAKLDPITDRDKWLAVRRQGIGGSDVPALLGISDYTSELDLWLDKTGQAVDDSAGEAALWGTLLEDPIAREWARRANVKVRRVGTLAHVDRDWMRTNLDRLVSGCPEHARCFLEVKNRNAYVSGDWGIGVPDEVEAQVQWSLGVTGFPAAHVAVLLGGNRLGSFTITRDDDLIGDLIAAGSEFWHKHVLAGIAPSITNADLLVDHLGKLAVDPADVLDVDDETHDRVIALLDRRRAAKAAEKAGEEIDNELRTIAGKRAVVASGDSVLFTWKSQSSKRIDVTALREADPDTAARFTKTSTSRVLRVPKARA